MQSFHNVLNLPECVKQNGTTQATYVYLADGTKAEVYTGGNPGTGSGYSYLGSLRYTRTGNTRQLESTPFAAGRFVKNTGGMQPYYHITDHLGSIRVITDKNGTVQEQNDYYPYGGRHTSGNTYAALPGNNHKFNGKEEQTTGNIGYLDYGARMYDNVTGRWSTPDPLAEKYKSMSPYNYCLNNPVIFVDPDGRAPSPIYDYNGNFLGTDNQGLQGKAIIMNKENFTQGMSHEYAMNIGVDLSTATISNFAYNRISSHYQSLPSRPDYDGYLTKSEADAWWKGKSGEPLFVDQSKIELPGVTTQSFENKEGKSLYKNFIWGLSNTGRVYGTLKLTLLDVNEGIVHIGGQKFLDRYDFEMDGRPLRNIATWVGRPGNADNGKSFIIFGYGHAKVPLKK